MNNFGLRGFLIAFTIFFILTFKGCSGAWSGSRGTDYFSLTLISILFGSIIGALGLLFGKQLKTEKEPLEIAYFTKYKKIILILIPSILILLYFFGRYNPIFNSNNIDFNNSVVEKQEVKTKDPLEFNSVYTFWDDNTPDANIHFGCEECDPGWHIEFKNESTAVLYAEPTHESNIRSCVSDVTYRYNSSTKVVTLLSISNNNVNNSCKNNFLGDWNWNEERGRFYSQNHPGAAFRN